MNTYKLKVLMIASCDYYGKREQLKEFTVSADACDIIGGSIYEFSAKSKGEEKVPGRWDIIARYPVQYTIIESIVEG